jgi:hypothetical protein
MPGQLHLPEGTEPGGPGGATARLLISTHPLAPGSKDLLPPTLGERGPSKRAATREPYRPLHAGLLRALARPSARLANPVGLGGD